MPNRYVSDPLDDLLQRSALSADKIDLELEQLAKAWQPTVLKPGHAILHQIRLQTGIDVVAIARQYRRLLVEIEQRKGRQLIWRYHELSRNRCEFVCPDIGIPHARGDALPGRPLRTLVEPTVALGAMTIDEQSRERDGWFDLRVTPTWREF
ncbi:MAG: hypothetical protein H2054_04185 [Sphingomonas sp.]|uniref:hypothetical protein n=1 Tax=Sphingomonas sp. TaxID=28214 RepID=UPI0018133AC3|nr:hypothetical protein [Zymomonas sp.]MBA4772291.1 hypothetical protein [Sphingomonas sp.]